MKFNSRIDSSQFRIYVHVQDTFPLYTRTNEVFNCNLKNDSRKGTRYARKAINYCDYIGVRKRKEIKKSVKNLIFPPQTISHRERTCSLTIKNKNSSSFFEKKIELTKIRETLKNEADADQTTREIRPFFVKYFSLSPSRKYSWSNAPDKIHSLEKKRYYRSSYRFWFGIAIVIFTDFGMMKYRIRIVKIVLMQIITYYHYWCFIYLM